MLSQNIKEYTKEAHQALEGIVVRRLKAVRTEADYIEILKIFYAYFREVEINIAPFITSEVLPDYKERRNSAYIKADIEELGGSIDELPIACAPEVYNALEALSALYVLEGSIMGGSYIVQMLNKHGIIRGTSFFAGYGEHTGAMWRVFVAVLNTYNDKSGNEQRAISVAKETFTRFGDVFKSVDV